MSHKLGLVIPLALVLSSCVSKEKSDKKCEDISPNDQRFYAKIGATDYTVSTQEVCFLERGISENRFEDCSRAGEIGRDCVVHFAIKRHDVRVCDMVKIPTPDRDYCIRKFSMEFEDKTVCKTISDEEELKKCEAWSRH